MMDDVQPDRFLVAPEMDARGFPGRYVGWPWVTPLAQWAQVSRAAMAESSMVRAITEEIVARLNDDCVRNLRTQLTTPTATVTDGHTADLFTRNQAMILVEVVTLNRAEPMQWPTFTPFPRIDRAARWLRDHWPPRRHRHEEGDW